MKVSIDKSTIHGYGLYIEEPVQCGDRIGTMFGHIHPLVPYPTLNRGLHMSSICRWVNHSFFPNCVCVTEDYLTWHLDADEDILKNRRECTIDYRYLPYFMDSNVREYKR